MMEMLKDFYLNTGDERVGVIDPNGNIIELPNVSAIPTQAFVVPPELIIKYVIPATATWHTHPGESSVLSGQDYEMISTWKDKIHYIIGNDGVRGYIYDKEKSSIVELGR